MNLSIKTQVGVLLATFMIQVRVKADIYFIPHNCSENQANLEITNTGSNKLVIWLQQNQIDADEVRYEITSGKKLILNPSAFNAQENEALSLKTWQPQQMKAIWSCLSENIIAELTQINSPEQWLTIPKGISSLQLNIANLSLLKNSTSLKVMNYLGQTIKKIDLTNLNYYETEKLVLNVTSDMHSLKLEANTRVSAWAFADGKNIQFKVKKPSVLNVDPSKKYFLVSTKTDQQDSFVISSNDENIITSARSQIADPDSEKIIIARIALGNDHNRSFSNSSHSPFSWSVTQIDSFADFALIDCDGSPEFVEDRLKKRLQAGGRICFWNYRILRELTPDEVNSGILNNTKP